MKLSYKWLKEYVDTKFSADQIADKLTMAGLEVEEVVGSQIFSGVVIGEVISKEKHPNADKLNVAVVNVGKDKLQIVCGAQNLAAGQRVPVALVGAKLGDFEISKAKLRGIESNGMICSEKELGISDEHEGIMVLEGNAPIGNDFGEYLGTDSIIDVKILANRPDCMSVIGLAREVSALTGEKLVLPEIKFSESKDTLDINVNVVDQKLCSLYMGRAVYGVARGNTPTWMKERLLASGMRSIDLLVDISNYVMLEYGQPLHFFDLDLLTDKTITVRPAKEGEQITTLDGMKRKLSADNLVIANTKEAIAIAGVMGGETTEINSKTTNIFVEAAVFDKASVRRTSRSLGLRSEAVARFEKGIGLATPEVALTRAVQLLADLAGGQVAAGLVDVSVSKHVNQEVLLSTSLANAFLGTKYSEKEVEKVLGSLGFILNKKVDQYSVTVPDWRVDVNEPVDLYEELSRVIGFDKIEPTMPYGVAVMPRKNDFYEFLKRIRKQVAGMGFSEIMTYSFAAEKELTLFGEETSNALEVANPLVKEQRYMRTSLVPKMLESLAANQYNRESIHFFEIGKTFHKNGKKAPIEKTWLSLGVIGGSSWPLSLPDAPNFYDLKGAVGALLESLGIANSDMITKELGFISEIKPEVAAVFGLKRPVAVAEIELEKLIEMIPVARIYHEISKFQKVERDITFSLRSSHTAGNIARAIKDPLISQVEIVDVYQEKGSKERAITIRLELLSSDHTLTDEEVDKVVNLCQNEITKLGGNIKGVKN